jgi:hypothetical protein
VAAFNIIPSAKLYDSNVRTLKTVFDRVDLYHCDDDAVGGESVIVIAPLGPAADAEALMQKAVVAQERYKFRFDVAKLAREWWIEVPKKLKGELLTDDFAPVNVYDSYGRRYRRKM